MTESIYWRYLLITISFFGAYTAKAQSGNPEYELMDLNAVKPIFKEWKKSNRKAYHLKSKKPYQIHTGGFQFEAILFGRKQQLEAHYAIPINASGSPLSSAEDIVCCFAYPTENLFEMYAEVKELATHYGFTMVAIVFNHTAAYRKVSQPYVLPESGSDKYWNKVIKAVRILAHFPEKKVYLLGYSAGGSAAQQYASAHSSNVAALAALAGRTYNVDTPYCGPTLLLRNEHDRIYENEELENVMEQNGAYPLHLTFPQVKNKAAQYGAGGHFISKSGWQIAGVWLSTVANLYIKNKGKLPDYKKWPDYYGQKIPHRNFAKLLTSKFGIKQEFFLPKTGHLVVKITPPGEGHARLIWIDNRWDINHKQLSAPVSIISQDRQCFALGGGPYAESYSALAAGINSTKKLRLYDVVLVSPNKRDIRILSKIAKCINHFIIIYNDESLNDKLLKGLAHFGKKSYMIISDIAPIPAHIPKRLQVLKFTRSARGERDEIEWAYKIKQVLGK